MNNRPKNFDKTPLRAAPPRPAQIDPETLSSLHCPQCLNNAFNSVHQFLEVPAVIANTYDGQPALMRVEVMLCVSCGAIWNIQQLKKLSPAERMEARINTQLRHEAIEEAKKEVAKQAFGIVSDLAFKADTEGTKQ